MSNQPNEAAALLNTVHNNSKLIHATSALNVTNSTQYPLTTFHLFPKLAPELQIRIWELAVYALPSRKILIGERPSATLLSDDVDGIPPLTPALLHACHDSRFVALKYHFIFPDISQKRDYHRDHLAIFINPAVDICFFGDLADIIIFTRILDDENTHHASWESDWKRRNGNDDRILTTKIFQREIKHVRVATSVTCYGLLTTHFVNRVVKDLVNLKTLQIGRETNVTERATFEQELRKDYGVGNIIELSFEKLDSVYWDGCDFSGYGGCPNRFLFV